MMAFVTAVRLINEKRNRKTEIRLTGVQCVHIQTGNVMDSQSDLQQSTKRKRMKKNNVITDLMCVGFSFIITIHPQTHTNTHRKCLIRFFAEILSFMVVSLHLLL